MSPYSAEIVVPLIGSLSIAPAWRADVKGIVERRFKIINDELIHGLMGTTKGRYYIRGDKDPRRNACYTLNDVTGLLIREILEHNDSIKESLIRQSRLLPDNSLIPAPETTGIFTLSYTDIHYVMPMRLKSGLNYFPKELSDAPVPFDFDVHAMISCDDAPALERALHSTLEAHRINKVNLRKEFFRVELEKIISEVKRQHGSIDYIADPAALQYWQSQESDGENVAA